MSALDVAFYALGTKHSVIKRKFLPRFEPNDLIAANFELDAALLPAKTAMRFYKAFGGMA